MRSMWRTPIIAVAATFAALLLPASSGAAHEGRFVLITEPFVNVYEVLDPQSPVVKLAKRGDRLELIDTGVSWFQVRVGDKTGWVERRAGTITGNRGPLAPLLPVAVVLLLFVCTVSFVGLRITRQREI
jgi:hypothetical protein